MSRHVVGTCSPPASAGPLPAGLPAPEEAPGLAPAIAGGESGRGCPSICQQVQQVAWHLASRLAAPGMQHQSGPGQRPPAVQPGRVAEGRHVTWARVTLLQHLSRHADAGVDVALARKAWRAVRGGLRAAAFSRSQAANLLHAAVRLGYHVPAADLRQLLVLSLQPLPEAQSAGAAPAACDAELAHLSKVMWAAAHAGRWSIQHRRGLVHGQVRDDSHGLRACECLPLPWYS